ncbi:MAG: dihydroorotase, partial [Clostridia bacterium]|nr:dihydroorotase [Clostridia bacterium]
MLTIKNGKVFMGGRLVNTDIYIENDKITKIAPGLEEKGEVIDASGKIVSHGFIDMHVHLREPGFEHKETIKTGTAAAAKGGFTTICPMPNLNPVPDTVANVQYQLDLIEKDACINVFPFAAITKGEKGKEIVNMIDIAPYVVGFSDDGKGIQTKEMMDKVMMIAGETGVLVSAHCEDEALLNGGYIHDGIYAKVNGHRGIVSECEYGQVIRDIALAEKYGARYHVCHISAKESIEAVRKAKAKGSFVTCEVTPHHIALCDTDITEDHGRFKMNPPLRDASDREAILNGILDGTIDCIATDHAPHSVSDKSKGLANSAMGIVGSETAFAVSYTALCMEHNIPVETLLELMTNAG